MSRWYREGYMANAFAALDDATLRDIGVCRRGMSGSLASSARLTRHDMYQSFSTLAPDSRQVSFLLVDSL
jgi:hypothetical protein